MPESSILTIEIKNSEPIELEDLTQGLQSLGDEYRRWLTDGDETALAADVRLYVKEMRSGSIIAQLIALAPLALPFIENANTIFGFCQYLDGAYGWLLGKRDQPPKELDRPNYQNLSNIVEAVAKDSKAQINIGTMNINAPVQITINSMEANAAQNRAKREAEKLQEPITDTKEKVVLYWYQARNDSRARTGDKAVIESVHRGPVKALCVNESIKTKMVLGADNPFTHAYVVDVTVETVKGKPVLYRILDVHERLELSNGEAI